MDPIQVGTIESAIMNNLVSGNSSKFVEAIKPLGLTDYTGANLFGDGKIDALLNDAMKKIDTGISYDEACKDLMDYVKSAASPTTVNASMVEDLNNKIDSMSIALRKLCEITQNFSVDSNSPAFKDGKALAESEPGKSKEDLDKVCSEKGLEGQDATNFKFGYNCVDKKAPNIGSGESKIDQNHSEVKNMSEGDETEYYVTTIMGVPAATKVYKKPDGSWKVDSYNKIFVHGYGTGATKEAAIKDFTNDYGSIKGSKVSKDEYDKARSELKKLGFSEVTNMSNDDKIKEAVKGKVKGTYKWSKDGKTLAIIGVSEKEFKDWKDLVADVLGPEVAVIGAATEADLPSNIQFCDESTTFSVKKEYFSSESETPENTNHSEAPKDPEEENAMKEGIKDELMSEKINQYEMAFSKLADIASTQADQIKTMSEKIDELSKKVEEMKASESTPENCSEPEPAKEPEKKEDEPAPNPEKKEEEKPAEEPAKAEMSEDEAKVAEENDKKVAEKDGEPAKEPEKKDEGEGKSEAQNHSFSATNEVDRRSVLKSIFEVN